MAIFYGARILHLSDPDVVSLKHDDKLLDGCYVISSMSNTSYEYLKESLDEYIVYSASISDGIDVVFSSKFAAVVDGLIDALDEIEYGDNLTGIEKQKAQFEAIHLWKQREILISADKMTKEALLSQNNDIPQLSVFFDPGSASDNDIVEILSDISILYRMMGGSGINFENADIIHLQNEMEYE